MLLRWRPRRGAVAVALAVVSILGIAAAPALAQPAPVPGPVVLIGTGGVRWSATGPSTPQLRSFLGNGAVGLLSVRSVRTSTCPVDGWLAVSAGARAADEAGPCRTPAFTAPRADGAAASVARGDVYRRLAVASSHEARPGLLRGTLAGGPGPGGAGRARAGGGPA